MQQTKVNTTLASNTTEILLPNLAGIWDQLNSAATHIDATTFFLGLGLENMAEFIPENAKSDFDKLWHLNGEFRKSMGELQSVTDQLAEACRVAKGGAQ